MYDEKLWMLHEQILRKKHLEEVLTDLRIQRSKLTENVKILNEAKINEQADVDHLENGSLASFFYNVVGKMDEKLTKEREEAYAAAVRYDVAAKELEAVEADIQKAETELHMLQNCETQYEELLAKKKESIIASGNPGAEKLLKLEERISYLKNQKHELKEAIEEARKASRIVEGVMESLDSAEGWGTWDILGGGMIADVVKYGHLDDAQKQIENLQVQLRRLKTELADVTIDEELNVNVDGFLQFADFFFDNLFTDWAVLDQISRSKDQVKETQRKIDGVLNKLYQMDRAADEELKQTKEELEELIVQTRM